MRSRFAFTVLAGLAAASGPSASGLSAQDTVVVRLGKPEWGTRPRVVEEMRIGVLEGDERYTFGRVGDVALGDDDELWVTDTQANQIRIFDDHGRAKEPVGRDGEGPGEFTRLSDIEALPGGGMAVWDQGLFRVSIFNKDGSFLRSFPVPTNVMIGAPTTLRATVTGDVFVATLGKALDEPDNFILWLRVSQDGEVVNSLPAPPRQRHGPAAYAVRTEAAVSPHGYLVQGRGDQWILTHPRVDLRVLRIEREVDPVPFGLAERRAAAAREEFIASRSGDPPADIPRVKPVFKGLDVDQEGRIWVRRHTEAIRIPQTPGEEAMAERAQEMFGGEPPPPQEWRERAVYDVVEDDGTFLGTVEFPYWNSRLVAAKGRRAWVVQTGDYGENYVVQYRIERGN